MLWVALSLGMLAAVIAIWGIITQRAISRRGATLNHIAKAEWDGDVIASRKKFIQLAKAEGGLAHWAEKAHEGSEEV